MVYTHKTPPDIDITLGVDYIYHLNTFNKRIKRTSLYIVNKFIYPL